MSLIFVDVEAHRDSPCPGVGRGMTEFGAVEYKTGESFHGEPDPYILTPEAVDWNCTFYKFDRWLKLFKGPYVFVSDNPAYDWQWINYWFWKSLGRNPFGHSARRIGDFYAGLRKNFWQSNEWKMARKTKHDHDPVNDARGNVEAFRWMLEHYGVPQSTERGMDE